MFINSAGDIRLDIWPGEIFRCPPRTLTNAHSLLFASISCDVHPIHQDAEFASHTGFTSPLIHGLLLASLTALGSSDGHAKTENFVIVEQSCRYLKPAHVGDTVYPSLTVEKLWEQDHQTFCQLSTSILDQHGELLLTGFQRYLVLPPATI